MRLKKLDKIKNNVYIQALRKQIDHRDLIEQMKLAESDEQLLYIAKQIVIREQVHKEMLSNLIELLYEQESGQHSDTDNEGS